MKISACMIAKNEEKNIKRCIESYKEIVDEIIVIDTGSEDKTVEIAENLGAQVYHFKWIDDFAAAKNFALDKAKGDWIIFLDADEYFDKDCAWKIRDILNSLNGTKYIAVGCKMINMDEVNDKILESFMQARIFKNHKDIRYRNSIHETLSYKNKILHMISYYDQITIYHTGYSSNITLEKAKRNLNILLDNISKNGEDPDYYRYLCDCYFSLEDYESALKYGEMHIKSKVKVPGYQSKIYKVVIDCMWKLKKPKMEIEKKIREAIEIFKDHPNFYCAYGFFLMDEKRYEEALENLLFSIKCNEEYEGIEVNLMFGLITLINFKIGSIYEMKNSYEKALEYYCLALNKDRYNKIFFNAVFNIIKKEKPEDIIAFLNSIYNIGVEKDVKFLIDEFIKVKPKGVLAFYTNIWLNKFGHEDSSLTFTMLAEEKYNTVYKIFYKGYLDEYDNSSAVLCIVSALLSGDINNVMPLLEIMKPAHKRILMNYLNKSKFLLDEDLDEYIKILRELLLTNKKDVINGFLNIKENFETNILPKVAMVFMDNNMYKEAAECYEKFNESFEVKEMYVSKGFCYFKLKQYKMAYKNFKMGIDNGYNENDVFEFINWTKEQCGELK